MVIKKNKNIVGRKIHDSSFLIDISDNYSGDKCAVYEINEIGLFIWNNIDGRRSVQELVSLLKAAIIDDVDCQTLHEDIEEFIDSLKARHFVEV